MINYIAAAKKNTSKYSQQFEAIQKEFNLKVVELNLTHTSERNELWDKDFKKKWDKLIEDAKKEAIDLWYKFHNPHYRNKP